MAENQTPLPIPETGIITNGFGTQRSVKRPRPVKSCFECRKRKLKCDRLLPCSQCQKSQRNCHYAAEGDGANLSDGSDAETIERAPKRASSVANYDSASKSRDRSQQVPAASVLEDHATRLDRLERLVLVGSNSSSMKEFGTRLQPISSSKGTIRGITVKGRIRTRFFGQNSTRVLLNLVSRPCAVRPYMRF